MKQIMGVTTRGFLDINTRDDEVLLWIRSQKYLNKKTTENFVQWRNYDNMSSKYGKKAYSGTMVGKQDSARNNI